MQPYPNPNYYQNYMQPQQQFYNQPAVQQYQQPSYMQQAAQRINGRVVQSADMITANDVPMDGSVAFFPTQDLSEIYAKSWDANGKIVTRLFKPISDSYPSNPSQETEKLKIGLSDEATEVFNKHFDTLFSKIEELEKKIDEKTLAKTTSRSKISSKLVQDCEKVGEE